MSRKSEPKRSSYLDQVRKALVVPDGMTQQSPEVFNVHDIICTQAMKLDAVADSLHAKAVWLIRDLADIVHKLESPDWHKYSINSLGVIQQSGNEIDRLCGLLDAHKETLSVLYRAIGKDFVDKEKQPTLSFSIFNR